MALITFRRVTLAFGGPPLLDGVNLSLQAGERLCVIGRNGEGKSTLLKVMAGTLTPDQGEVVAERGLRLATLPQEVPQDVEGTVQAVVASGAADRTALWEDWQIDSRALNLCQRLGLDPDAEFAALSGGRKRLALLARAVVGEPDVLLLDEPTNHLDIDTIDWLERFLLSWSGALVFISHDRAFLGKLATRLVALDRGRLQEYPGDYATYLARREAELDAENQANALFDKKLAEEEVWIRQGIKARRTRNEGRVRALKALRAERAQRRTVTGTAQLQAQEAQRSGRLVLEATDLCLSLGGQRLIDHFSTVVQRGDKIGLIGPNGVGKTSLIRVLLGSQAPDAGQVRLGTQLAPAYFDQLRGALDLEASVRDNLSPGSDFIDINGQPKHVLAYLQDFLFSPQRARTPVKALSGGERNRLLLARLFAQPSNLLILDEPTNDLDVETLELLEALLVSYTGTVLLISHDRAFLNEVVTQTWVFEGQGRISEYVGGYDDWLRQRPEPPAAAVSASTSASAATSTTKPVPATRKLSFKEQRELAALPDEIAALEAEQADAQAALADGRLYVTDHVRATALAERLGVIEETLLARLERWAELES